MDRGKKNEKRYFGSDCDTRSLCPQKKARFPKIYCRFSMQLYDIFRSKVKTAPGICRNGLRHGGSRMRIRHEKGTKKGNGVFSRKASTGNVPFLSSEIKFAGDISSVFRRATFKGGTYGG